MKKRNCSCNIKDAICRLEREFCSVFKGNRNNCRRKCVPDACEEERDRCENSCLSHNRCDECTQYDRCESYDSCENPHDRCDTRRDHTCN